MLAYEFYSSNGEGREVLVGILPERRKDSERITRESVINWAREMAGNNMETKRIFFIEVEV